MGRPSLTWASLRWNAASLSALSWQHSPLAATGTLGPARLGPAGPHGLLQAAQSLRAKRLHHQGHHGHALPLHQLPRDLQAREEEAASPPGSAHQDSFDRRVFSEGNSSSSSVLSRPPRSCARLQLLEAMLTVEPPTTPSWLRQIRKQVLKDNHTPMQRHTKLAQPSITGDQ